MGTVKVPDDVFDSLKYPEEDKQEMMKTELAVTLYSRGALSFGKARELAEKSKQEFQSELAERNIERHYGEEEMKEDLEYGLK